MAEASNGNSGDDLIQQGVDRIRDTAKWLIAAFAAIGAVLIAGTQLSSVGGLPTCLPRSADCLRLWVALPSAALALGAVAFAVSAITAVLLPRVATLSSLRKELSDPKSKIAGYFRSNPELLQGFPTIESLACERERLVKNQSQLAEQYDRTEDAAGRKQLASRLEEVYADLKDLEDRISQIADTADYQSLSEDFRKAVRRVFFCGAIAATGIAAFAWAANPPQPDQPAPSLRGANLTGALLTGANLVNADVTGTDFTNANLRGANMSGVDPKDATWKNTICPDGTNSDLADGTCAGHLEP